MTSMVHILVTAFLVAGAASAAGEKHVMPWMCLSRCGANQSQIQLNLQQIVDNTDVFDYAAFEKFNLGANKKLILNNFTDVGTPLNKAGVYTNPMISSYPYPKGFLDWMRAVFSDPMPFMKQLLEQCQMNGYNAVNIDWEPTTNKEVTRQDAIDYANFLDTLAKFMHPYKIQVTVDVATWSPIWDLQLINDTAVDWIVTMSTYTDNQTTWFKEVDYALKTISLDKLMIGLETMRNDGSPYSIKDLQERFDKLVGAGVNSIGLWKSPVPEAFMPFLRGFKKQ